MELILDLLRFMGYNEPCVKAGAFISGALTRVYRKGGCKMSEVRIGKTESIDSALRRFKRSCQKSGVLSEVRKREHYEKPSVRRKKKSEAARKRKFK